MKVLSIVLAAALCASAHAQAVCDGARAECAASCDRQGLGITSFLCRETPFGVLQSCSCGAPTQEPTLPLSESDALWSSDSSSSDSSSSSEVILVEEFSSSSDSSAYPFALPGATLALADALPPFFVPRRFGPFEPAAAFPAAPFAGQGLDQIRSAFLADLLAQQQRSRPTLVITFETQPAEHAVLLRDPEGFNPHARSGEAEDEDELMGAGCAIMMLATVALFAGVFTCFVRACLAACPRRTAARPARQVVVDCTAGELTSPLLVVDETDTITVVQHTKA